MKQANKPGLALAFLFLSHAAYAYRPFISTDAAVADLHQVELEMGYYGLTRNGGSNTYSPLTVLNYGVWNRLFASFYDLLAVRWIKQRMFKYRVSETIN